MKTNKLTVSYLKNILDKLGVDYPKTARKSDLIEILDDLVVKYKINDYSNCCGGGRLSPNGAKTPRHTNPNGAKNYNTNYSKNSSKATSKAKKTQKGGGKVDESLACKACSNYIDRSERLRPYTEEEIDILKNAKEGCDICSEECFSTFKNAKAMGMLPEDIDEIRADCDKKTRHAILSKKEYERLEKKRIASLERKIEGISRVRAENIKEGRDKKGEFFPKIRNAPEIEKPALDDSRFMVRRKKEASPDIQLVEEKAEFEDIPIPEIPKNLNGPKKEEIKELPKKIISFSEEEFEEFVEGLKQK